MHLITGAQDPADEQGGSLVGQEVCACCGSSYIGFTSRGASHEMLRL
jgi:hypothetical protein